MILFISAHSRSIKDSIMLPCIDSTMDTCIGDKYFSKLDLLSSYWQVWLSENDKDKTAFSDDNLEFHVCNRLANGLTNASTTFQRFIELCIRDLNLKESLIFLNDILVFSHWERLEAVFQLFRPTCLKVANLNFRGNVNYLGHVVSQGGAKIDTKKLHGLNRIT